MRTTLIALGALGSLAAVLTACSGGGGVASTAPATIASPGAAASMNPNQVINNFTGPSSQVTVSIKVPARVAPPAGLNAKMKALYGSWEKDAHLRSMRNTSPSASIRALGAQIHDYATSIRQSTGRDPTFISSNTASMEFVLSSGTSVLVDAVNNACNTSSCTATFAVPVGSGYTATIYLYDNCDFLIGAGSTANVTVNAGNNSPLLITINGVVAHFNVTSTATTPFIADPTQMQNFNLNIQALDWDNNVITTPGVLLDSNFDQITGLSIAVDAADVTPANPPVTLLPNLSFAPVPYNFAGTGTEATVDWTATEVHGGQLVPSFNTQGNAQGTDPGTLTITDVTPTLQWVNSNNYPQAATLATDPQLAGGGTIGSTAIEYINFPTQQNTNTYDIGLLETIANYPGNVTITATGCAGIIGAFPGAATPYLTFASSPWVMIRMASSATSAGVCDLLATDGAGRTAELIFNGAQSNLTIQNTARTH